MKNFTYRIVSVGLIFLLIVLQMPVALADEATSSVGASPEVVVESVPTPVVDPTPVISTSTSPISDPAPQDISATTTPPEIVATSTASTTNVVTTDASTGDNHITDAATTTATTSPTIVDASSTPQTIATSTLSETGSTTSPTGTSTIISGNALSNGTVTNIENTNLINSDALLSVLNNVSSGDGSVDLRGISNGGSSCATCSVSTTSLANPGVQASTTNNGTINNVVIVRSNTGDNTSSSTNSLIATGDAIANANVVNVANTNIIDSRYLVLVLNNVGNLNGDVVLPTADFFDQFLQASTTHSNSTSPLSVATTNDAHVANQVTTISETGNNTASTTDSSIIATGNSYAASTIVNDINQNHIGDNTVGITFRIFGDWSGQIFNVPAGFSAQTTPDGIRFVRTIPQTMSTSTFPSTGYTLQNNNTATISNTVLVSATTGNNAVEGDRGIIATGDAYATANIVNVANTNIVGSNWLNAIINIFGDWHGNVSFGQPDLWVGTRADVKDGNPTAGGEVTYHYSIKNNGDAPAHAIVLQQTTDSSLITLADTAPIDAGTLAPGEVKSFDRVAHIAASLPNGDTQVASTITVQAQESDGNTQDNTDHISVIVHGGPQYTGIVNYEPVLYGWSGPFTVTKSNSATGPLTASSSVDYSIHIKNNSSYIDHAILHDEITDEKGNIIHQEDWDLGSVDGQEEIDVSYTAFFNASTSAGIYTNSAQVYSPEKHYPDSQKAVSSIVISGEAPHELTIEHLRPQGKVLGASIALASIDTQEPTDIIATSTATSSATLVSAPTAKQGRFMSLLAAIRFIPLWFWLLLIIIGTGVYLSDNRRKMS